MFEALETPRLVVRKLSFGDLAACQALDEDASLGDVTLSDAENLQRRQRWLEWTLGSYVQLEQLYQPPYGERAIEERESGSLVGLVGFVPLLAPFGQLACYGAREGAPYTAEVGLFWALRSGWRGRGIATEAARAMLALAFDELKLARVFATTERSNPRSAAVMERLGMRIERNPFPSPPWLQVVGIIDAP